MNYRLKGLAPLLEAFALVTQPSARLVVVGHPKFGRYERQARRLGVANRVSFLGHRTDPKNCYFAADFLVHPTFYDPCSLVALEALACGLPVITTRYNGASELLSPPSDGLVINDPHDAASLASAMANMLDRGYLRDAAQRLAWLACVGPSSTTTRGCSMSSAKCESSSARRERTFREASLT